MTYSYTINVTPEIMDCIADNFDLVLPYDDDSEYMHVDNVIYLDDIEEYVTEYYDYHYCHSCGRYVSSDGWDYDQDVCIDCREESIIQNWHSHKHSFDTIGIGKPIGVELEVDEGADSNGCAEEVANILGDNHVLFERDGSLSSVGFEIITQPHSVDEFYKLDFEGAFNTIKSYGYVSHNAGNCGLHIHFDASWFGDNKEEQKENIAIMSKFYRKNFDLLAKLSRRSDFQYCYNDSFDNGQSLENLYITKKNGTRYNAVNLNNINEGLERLSGTVEYRLGRGTLKIDTFYAWIDLHIAITKASKTASNYDVMTWINPKNVKHSTWCWIKEKLGNDFKKYFGCTMEEIEKAA